MTRTTATTTTGRELTTTARENTLTHWLAIAEHALLRYGLALVLIWIGGMKFTSYEAHGILGLETTSPFMRPLLAILGIQGLADALGVTEIITAVLLVSGRFFPRVGLVGSAVATLMFLTTLSFMITAPGWEPSLGGFPALSGGVGQFIIKDVVLLGAAIYTARQSLASISDNRIG